MTGGERAALWLPLLRRMTGRFPKWCVWKNAESALYGHGDVDSLAPPEDWPEIEAVWVEWLRENGLGPAVVCRHVPQGPHFVALQDGSSHLVQFDVKERITLRGATLMRVEDLAPMAERDERGFRRIRPGAEGVIKLVYNALRPGGRKSPEGLRMKRVPELLAADPEGVEEAARRLFGPVAPALRRAVEAVVQGGWDRPAMLGVEAWFLARSVAEPGTALGRVWFNRVSKKRCPVLQVIRERDRRLPADREAWLRRVAGADGHRMVHP